MVRVPIGTCSYLVGCVTCANDNEVGLSESHANSQEPLNELVGSGIQTEEGMCLVAERSMRGSSLVIGQT